MTPGPRSVRRAAARSRHEHRHGAPGVDQRIWPREAGLTTSGWATEDRGVSSSGLGVATPRGPVSAGHSYDDPPSCTMRRNRSGTGRETAREAHHRLPHHREGFDPVTAAAESCPQSTAEKQCPGGTSLKDVSTRLAIERAMRANADRRSARADESGTQGYRRPAATPRSSRSRVRRTQRCECRDDRQAVRRTTGNR